MASRPWNFDSHGSGVDAKSFSAVDGWDVVNRMLIC